MQGLQIEKRGTLRRIKLNQKLYLHKSLQVRCSLFLSCVLHVHRSKGGMHHQSSIWRTPITSVASAVTVLTRLLRPDIDLQNVLCCPMQRLQVSTLW